MSCDKTTHYGISMNSATLKHWAKLTVKKIVKSCTADNVIPVLIYTGMSGIATATALSMYFPPKFRFILEYVRKEGEKTHGRKVEKSDSVVGIYGSKPTNLRYYLVDDFISSGTTFETMITLFQDYYGEKLNPEEVLTVLSSESRIQDLKKRHGIKMKIIDNNVVITERRAAREKAFKEIFG